MEVKHKEVVIMKDIFVACDGTEFEDEDDCIDYECRLCEKKISCYDENFEKAELDSCYFVDATDEESLTLFKSLCNHYGYSENGIEGVGLYRYMDKGDYWLNISQIMTDFEMAREEEKNEHR